LLIGVLSDSHGQHLMVRKAMALFDDLGVEHVIHCGDIGGVRVFDEVVGRPLTFVWGNTDYESPDLLAYLDGAGLSAPSGIPIKLNLDGKSIAVFHGHERGFAAAVQDLEVDYIVHGHTHVAADEVFNGKRIINPGALHRARRKTVATLDTETDALVFHEIAES
jgi:putative phosphoesterase